MKLRVTFDCETDGRSIAEDRSLRDVRSYGRTRAEANAAVQARALRGVVDRLEHDEAATGSVALAAAR